MLLLPIYPVNSPDSVVYLMFADYRPPGYPIFLYVYRAIFGGLSYLPQVQFGLFFTSVTLLALSVACLTKNILNAVLIVVVGGYFAPDFWPEGVMSDPLYGSLLTTAAASFIFSVSIKRPKLVWSAALLFALAAVTRTIGYTAISAVAVSFSVLVFFRKLPARLAALLAGLPFALVMITACTITYAQTDHFRIGSYGGMSLLGKGLMIATPLPSDSPLSSLNWIPEETKPAQLEVARAPSLYFKMMLLRQYYEYLRWNKMLGEFNRGYYEYLRWNKMVGEFNRRWAIWASAGAGSEQSQLALKLSAQYIASNPLGYAKLVSLDYLALWSMPGFLTKREHDSLQRVWETMNVSFLTSFAKTDSGQNNYRAVVPQAYVSALQVWVCRTVSGLFALASVLVPILMLMYRNRLRPSTTASLVLLGLNVHFAYVATAMVEAGLERYVFPTWPLMVAALAISPYAIFSPNRDPRSVWYPLKVA
jgi:hypothetical protein